MARLSIHLLGAFHVRRDGETVTGIQTNKARALLAYLAVEAQRPHQRAHLAGLLWPDWPETQARTYLRQALANLQRVLNDDGASTPLLLTTRDTIQFDPASDVCLDVACLSEALVIAPRVAARPGASDVVKRLQKAVALYRGDFLQEFFLNGCSAFEEWQLLTRERLRRQVVETLGLLIQWHEEHNGLAQALRYAWQRVELEPLLEEGHQQLLRLLMRGGERNLALAHYQHYCRILQEELDATPSAATVALVDEIRAVIRVEEETNREDRSLQLRFGASPQPSVSTTVFVGREAELVQLDAHLATALAGHGHTVFMAGDAGAGKSLLIEEFARRAQNMHWDLLVAGGHCSSHRGIGDPLLPFRQILAQLTGDFTEHSATGWYDHDQAERLGKALPRTVDILLTHAPDLLDALVPRTALTRRVTQLLGEQPWRQRLDNLGGRVAATAATVQLQQRALFAQFTMLIQMLAQRQPLLLWLEDLHWVDLNSAALLFHCGALLANSPILIVGSYRPEEVAVAGAGQRHPLERVLHELQHLYGDIIVDLSQADGRHFVDAYLDIEPNCLDRTFRATLYGLSRGHPLFTAELLRSMRERGDLIVDDQERWIPAAHLNWQILPARVEAVIAERIQRLPPDLRAILDVASVQGERFTAQVIGDVLGRDEHTVVHQLSQDLVRQHQLAAVEGVQHVGEQRLAGYRFRHVLFQQYLYEQLDAVERAQLHEAVARSLEARHQQEPDRLAAIAGILAWHYRRASIPDKAALYACQSGSYAMGLAAFDEAAAHFHEGLTVLASAPDTAARSRLELELRMGLITCQSMTEGHGSTTVEQALVEALDLCRSIGADVALFRLLWHLWMLHFQRGNMRKAHEIATESLEIAQRTEEEASVVVAHEMLGPTLYRLGDMVAAHTHLLEARNLYEAQPLHELFSFGLDAGLHGRCNEALTLWYLGYFDQAQDRSAEALMIAEQSAHPYHLASAMNFTTALYQRAAKPEQTAEFARRTIQLSTEHKFALWQAVGALYHGWAVAAQGDLRAGLAETQRGSDAIVATGMKHIRFLAVLADVYYMTGDTEKALALVDDLLATVEATEEREWSAELQRLKGALLSQQGEKEQAEDCYRRAIAIARHQQAKSLELRATVSLCRLWQAQGKGAEARQMLADIYNWFTEGFDTRDLKEAQALLRELS